MFEQTFKNIDDILEMQ